MDNKVKFDKFSCVVWKNVSVKLGEVISDKAWHKVRSSLLALVVGELLGCELESLSIQIQEEMFDAKNRT